MIVFFTEEEEEHINKRPNKWTVKESCPDSMRPMLQRKLDYYYKPQYRQDGVK